jgi:hypothetical protein
VSMRERDGLGRKVNLTSGRGRAGTGGVMPATERGMVRTQQSLAGGDLQAPPPTTAGQRPVSMRERDGLGWKMNLTSGAI